MTNDFFPAPSPANCSPCGAPAAPPASAPAPDSRFDLLDHFLVEGAPCSYKPQIEADMKFIPLMLVFGLALSLCNLSKKLHGGGSSNTNSGTSSSSNSGGAAAEHGEATSAQVAALSGGSDIKWEQQGMSWSVPPKWTEATNESKMFVWRSPGGFDAANLIVNISPMDESFPT